MGEKHYLYDVFVNWTEGDSRCGVPEYSEWRESDNVEFMDKVPVVLVEPEFFNVIEYTYAEIPQELLDKVHREAIKVDAKSNRKTREDYVFILTDGEQVLAINTEGGKRPYFKSRLVPRQEEMVRQLVEDLPLEEYEIPEDDFNVEDDALRVKMYFLQPKYLYGLTRTEREKKVRVMDHLIDLSYSDNRSEVVYWYVELFPEAYNTEKLEKLSTEEMLEEMFDFLKVGWGDRHEEFFTTVLRISVKEALGESGK